MKIFLYILIMLIPAVFLILLDTKLFLTNKNTKNICKLALKDFLLLTFSNLAINSVILNTKNMLLPMELDYKYYLTYIGCSIVVIAIYLLIKLEIGRLFVKVKKDNLNKVAALACYYGGLVLLFIGTFAISGTIWGKNTYGNAKIDEIIVTLLSPMTGTDIKIILGFFEDSVIPTITITLLTAFIFYDRVDYKYIRTEKKLIVTELSTRLMVIILSSIVFISGFIYGFVQWDLGTLIVAYTVPSTYIEENYNDPGKVELTFPKQKRNLIHIYLESIENSYFDKANGGNMDTNLMPNLLALTKELEAKNEAVSFSHLAKDEGRGGPLNTQGATWSVASMVNQFFGVPMKVPAKRNAYGSRGNFLPGAVGVGDILKEAGYNQTMMVGADALFGGLKFMFEDHGGFKVIDHQYALEHHMLPTDDYKINWGFEDSKLYKFAKDEITRLSKEDKPFHFVMENADTHFPGLSFIGDEPEMGTSTNPVDYGKTISYSEKHVTEFIRWIINQPFYENTTIVVIGDHLSMDKTFFYENDFDDFNRTIFNLVINPGVDLKSVPTDRFYQREWGTYDMMPTLIAAMGIKIEGNRLGLGTNLFSSLPTVYERDNYNEVNSAYIRKSDFYNKELIKGKINYNGENIK